MLKYYRKRAQKIIDLIRFLDSPWKPAAYIKAKDLQKIKKNSKKGN